MADLDDFFAKKDKKKSKASKPKFLTADELSRALEDTSKREPTAKPKKPELVATAPAANANAIGSAVVASTAAVSSGGAPVTTAAVPSSGGGVSGDDEAKAKTAVEQVQVTTEEEWKEFEEEQRKDYSGLKIGQLSLHDEDDTPYDDGDDEDGDSEGNANAEQGGKRGDGGPWKKVIPAEEVTQIPVELEKPSSKVYILPALRHSQAMSSYGSGIKPRNRAAPDITNADFFPTLGAARPEEQRKKKNEPAFEEVRHGGRIQRVQETSSAPVAAANRFQSLDEDDS